MVIGRWTKLPRVTLLLLFGLLIRQIPWLPENIENWFPLITAMALSMVGFLLGEKLVVSFLQKNTRTILWVSVSEVLVTATMMLAGLILIGVPIEVALIFAFWTPRRWHLKSLNCLQKNRRPWWKTCRTG